MKIKITSTNYRTGQETTYFQSLADYADGVLCREPEDSGAMEAISARAGHAASAIGKLMDMLVAKGLMTTMEFTEVLNIPDYKAPVFVSDQEAEKQP